MNLYLISQSVNNNYDTYDSAVVIAQSERDARHTNPAGLVFNSDSKDYFMYLWAHPDDVHVTLLGTAVDNLPTVICASYNGG